MRHLKKFNAIHEQIDIATEGITSQAFSPSNLPEGDYDVTWQDESGNTIKATFKEITKQIEKEGSEGFTYFETVPGTSSDSAEYAAQAGMEDTGKGTYRLQSFLILPK